MTSNRDIDLSELDHEELTGLVFNLEKLRGSSEWKSFERLVRAQIAAQQRGLLAPLDTMDKALAQEFEKGLITGLETALEFPRLKAEQLREFIELGRRKGGMEEDHE